MIIAQYLTVFAQPSKIGNERMDMKIEESVLHLTTLTLVSGHKMLVNICLVGLYIITIIV